MKNKNINIEKFFDEHFAEMGEPNHSAEKDRAMLDNILREASDKTNKSIYKQLINFISDFRYFSPKYAVPIAGAAVLIIFLVNLLFFANDELPNFENNDSQIISKNIEENNADIDEKLKAESAETSETDNRIINNEKPSETEEMKVFTSEIALINYDFSTRSVRNDSDIQKKQVANLLGRYFRENGINFEYNNNVINTEWFVREGINTQVSVNINEDKKELELKINQKSGKEISTEMHLKKIKNEIEDIIIQNLAFPDAE